MLPLMAAAVRLHEHRLCCLPESLRRNPLLQTYIYAEAIAAVKVIPANPPITCCRLSHQVSVGCSKQLERHPWPGRPSGIQLAYWQPGSSVFQPEQFCPLSIHMHDPSWCSCEQSDENG